MISLQFVLDLSRQFPPDWLHLKTAMFFLTSQECCNTYFKTTNCVVYEHGCRIDYPEKTNVFEPTIPDPGPKLPPLTAKPTTKPTMKPTKQVRINVCLSSQNVLFLVEAGVTVFVSHKGKGCFTKALVGLCLA